MMMALDKSVVVLLHFTPETIHFMTLDKEMSMWGHLLTVRSLNLSLQGHTL